MYFIEGRYLDYKAAAAAISHLPASSRFE